MSRPVAFPGNLFFEDDGDPAELAEPAADKIEAGSIGQRAGDHLDRGDVLYRIEPPGHEQPSGPAKPGAQLGRGQSGRAAGQYRRHPSHSFHLLQEPLAVKQVAGGGVDDPVSVGHRVQQTPSLARGSGYWLAFLRYNLGTGALRVALAGGYLLSPALKHRGSRVVDRERPAGGRHERSPSTAGFAHSQDCDLRVGLGLHAYS